MGAIFEDDYFGTECVSVEDLPPWLEREVRKWAVEQDAVDEAERIRKQVELAAARARCAKIGHNARVVSARPAWFTGGRDPYRLDRPDQVLGSLYCDICGEYLGTEVMTRDRWDWHVRELPQGSVTTSPRGEVILR